MKKEIKIDERFGKEWAGTYIFETISWGISNEITSECTTMNPITRQSSIDLKKLQARMLYMTLTEKPKALTLEALMDSKGIPVVLGELLMGIADKVNGYGPEEREELKKLKQQWGLE